MRTGHWYIDFSGYFGVENWMCPLQSSSKCALTYSEPALKIVHKAWLLIVKKTCLICISMGICTGRKAHMHLLHTFSVCTGAGLKYLSLWLSVPGWICIKMQSQQAKTSSHLKMQAKLYNESPPENSPSHISWNLSTNSSSPKGLTQQVRGKSCSDLPATQALKLELLSYRAINKKPLWTSSIAVLRDGNMSTLSDLWQSKLTLKSGQSKWVMS